VKHSVCFIFATDTPSTYPSIYLSTSYLVNKHNKTTGTFYCNYTTDDDLTRSKHVATIKVSLLCCVSSFI